MQSCFHSLGQRSRDDILAGWRDPGIAENVNAVVSKEGIERGERSK